MPGTRKMVEMLDELVESQRKEIFDKYCGCGRKHKESEKILTSHCCVHQTPTSLADWRDGKCTNTNPQTNTS